MKKLSSKRSEVCLAAVQVGGNEDLLREIFLRLPARYLVKFKVVSKQWSCFISDPQFVQDHSKQNSFRSSTPSGLYFYNSLNKSEEIESVSLVDGPIQRSGIGVPSLSFLDGEFPGYKIKILQSCHGLLLCKLKKRTSTYTLVVNYCVCNPTTRNFKVIPSPPLLPTQSIVAISLAFDPSESLHYRLACVKHIKHYTYGVYTHTLEVYSSETGSWKTTSCFFRRLDSARFENAFYWNDTIHWVRYEVGYNVLFDEFDFKTEKLDIIHFPPMPRSDWNCKFVIRYFGQSRGYWHIIYIRSLSSYLFNVLEMDNDTFEWSAKYRVSIHRLLSEFPEIIRDVGPDQYYDAYRRDRVYAFHILSFIKGENDADSELVLISPGKVVSYNFKKKTFKVLLVLPSQVVDSSTFGFINSSQFVDSLCPV